MTKRSPLIDRSRSRAVLLGAWDYSDLSPVPAARHSLQRMADLLTGPWCGWLRENVQVWGNEQRPGDLPDRLLTAFTDPCDTALFYFVGHGLIDDEDGLCLALTATLNDVSRRATTGLPFETVRRALARSRAATKILILDCCFAGQAILRHNALSDEATLMLDLASGAGAYTMAASRPFETAWYEAEPDNPSPQTYFTKVLVDLVETGIPDAPDLLPVAQVFAHLKERLARDGRPVPVSRSVDSAHGFVFARNAAIARPVADRDVAHLAPNPGKSPVPGPVVDRMSDAEAHISRAKVNAADGPAPANLLALATSEPIVPVLLPVSGGSAALAISPDGRSLAADAADKVVLWDLHTQRTVETLDPKTGSKAAKVHAVAIGPDGRTLAAASSDLITLWDLRTREKRTLSGHRFEVHAVAFSPDGRTLASAGQDDSVRLWELASGLNTPLGSHHGRPKTTVAFSPDGTRIASGGRGKIRVWNLRDGSVETLDGHYRGTTTLSFHPRTGLLASGGCDGKVRIWELESRACLRTLASHSSNVTVTAVCWSSSGQLLAGGGTEGPILVWDQDGTILAALTGHESAVAALAFSPDECTLAASGRDDTIRLWNLRSLARNTRGLAAAASSPHAPHSANRSGTGTEIEPVRQPDARPTEPVRTLVPLDVPFADKDIVKSLGARWNPEVKQWFADVPLAPWLGKRP